MKHFLAVAVTKIPKNGVFKIEYIRLNISNIVFESIPIAYSGRKPSMDIIMKYVAEALKKEKVIR